MAIDDRTWDLIDKVECKCFDVLGVKGVIQIFRKSDYSVSLFVNSVCKYVVNTKHPNQALEWMIDRLGEYDAIG